MAEPLRSVAIVVGLLAAVGAAAQQPPGESAASTDALRRARDSLIMAEDFSAALDPAERVVERLDDATAADDLLRLARIQAELEMYADAELNFLAAIEHIRENDGEFARALIPAYRALGRSYIGERDFAAALAALEQARHVSQRTDGLFNVEQSAIIDDLTTAHLGRGETTAARDLQVERLENATRRFGQDDPRIVPYLHHLARYFDSSRLRGSARDLYEHSLALQESAYGPSDPRLLPTLRELLKIDFTLGDIGELPERIEQIAESSADIAVDELSASFAVLGDAALLRGLPDEARAWYARAYASLDPAAALERFAQPLMLDFIPPISPVDRATRNRPYTWGRVVLEFDVTPEGRATGIDVVRIEPAGRVGQDYAQRIAQTRFRPRLVDGMPVATRGVRTAHDFRYYVNR